MSCSLLVWSREDHCPGAHSQSQESEVLLYSRNAGSFGPKIIFCVREPENGLKGELLLDCSPLTWTSKEETCMQNS